MNLLRKADVSASNHDSNEISVDGERTFALVKTMVARTKKEQAL